VRCIHCTEPAASTSAKPTTALTTTAEAAALTTAWPTTDGHQLAPVLG